MWEGKHLFAALCLVFLPEVKRSDTFLKLMGKLCENSIGGIV